MRSSLSSFLSVHRPHLPSLLLVIGLLLSMQSALGLAQDGSTPTPEQIDEVLVTANHVPTKAQRSGASVSTINVEDFAEQVNFDLANVLRQLPSMSVNRAGPLGALTQIRIRGAEANHTLVMIDGVEVNDIGNGSEFNFAHLASTEFARVEVLRGPQSARFGADAIGGVVSIFTADPQELGWSGLLGAELGEHHTRSSRLRTSYVANGDEFSGFADLSLSRMLTDGTSASPTGSERDGFTSDEARLKSAISWGDNSELRLVLSRSDISADGDKQDFDFPATATQGLVIDANELNESQQSYGQLRLSTVTGAWHHEASASRVRNASDYYVENLLTSGLRGRRTLFDVSTRRDLDVGASSHSIQLAWQQESRRFRNVCPSIESANYSDTDRQRATIAEYVFDVEKASVAVSRRWENNQRFADAATWRITANRELTSGVQAHASWAEGTANPTFFELTGFIPNSFTGNPDLQPESSNGWDIGMRLLRANAIALDVTYFDAKLKNEIITFFDSATFTSSPVNEIGKSRRSGWELSFDVSPFEDWQIQGHFTWLDSEDPNGQTEVRRPRRSGALTLQHSFANSKGKLSILVNHNGSMFDSEFINATPETRVKLDSFTTLGMAASYRWRPNWTISLRGDNLLQSDYQEVFGFASPGSSLHLSTALRL